MGRWNYICSVIALYWSKTFPMKVRQRHRHGFKWRKWRIWKLTPDVINLNNKWVELRNNFCNNEVIASKIYTNTFKHNRKNTRDLRNPVKKFHKTVFQEYEKVFFLLDCHNECRCVLFFLFLIACNKKRVFIEYSNTENI